MKVLRVAKNISTVVLITIFLIIALDIAVRLYLCVKNKDARFLKINPTIAQKIEFPLPDKEDFKGYYKFKPGVYKCRVSALETESEIVEYAINSKGLRGEEFTSHKAENTMRVFCLGGSSTMGQNSPHEETYPSMLERLLRKKNPDERIEVINAGVSGYSMENIYNLFKNELLDYGPDIITVYSAFNDASFARNLTVKKTSPALRLHRLLYYRWMLYTLLVEKYSVIKHKNPIPGFTYERWSPLESYRRNLERLVYLAKENGIDVILIKQPINIGMAIDCDKETTDMVKERIEKSDSMEEIRALTQIMLVKEMERIGESNGLKVVDPIGEFKENKNYFIDEVHLTKEGNLRLAGIITESIDD